MSSTAEAMVETLVRRIGEDIKNARLPVGERDCFFNILLIEVNGFSGLRAPCRCRES